MNPVNMCDSSEALRMPPCLTQCSEVTFTVSQLIVFLLWQSCSLSLWNQVILSTPSPVPETMSMFYTVLQGVACSCLIRGHTPGSRGSDQTTVPVPGFCFFSFCPAAIWDRWRVMWWGKNKVQPGMKSVIHQNQRVTSLCVIELLTFVQPELAVTHY